MSVYLQIRGKGPIKYAPLKFEYYVKQRVVFSFMSIQGHTFSLSMSMQGLLGSAVVDFVLPMQGQGFDPWFGI